MNDFGMTPEEMLSEDLVNTDYFEYEERKKSKVLDSNKGETYLLKEDEIAYKLIENNWVKIDIEDVPEEVLFQF